jgi:hypothetical protein
MTIKCPKCGSDAKTFGSVPCLCDKDFCTGQRCSANSLSAQYKCQNPECGAEGVPPDTVEYHRYYCSK